MKNFHFVMLSMSLLYVDLSLIYLFRTAPHKLSKSIDALEKRISVLGSEAPKEKATEQISKPMLRLNDFGEYVKDSFYPSSERHNVDFTGVEIENLKQQINVLQRFRNLFNSKIKFLLLIPLILVSLWLLLTSGYAPLK
jgi:hypothetical protein